MRAQFDAAGREETNHLAWTESRLHDLGDRPSLLNPLWYAGAFGIGLVAGRVSDAVSAARAVRLTARSSASATAGPKFDHNVQVGSLIVPPSDSTVIGARSLIRSPLRQLGSFVDGH